MLSTAFAAALIVGLTVAPPAETAADWLTESLEEALSGPDVDPRIKAGILAAAQVHAANYLMEDLSDCHIAKMEDLVAYTESFHGKGSKWEYNKEPVGNFTHRLIEILYEPEYAPYPDDRPMVEEQMALLADALVEAVTEQLPDIMDADMQASLHEQWLEELDRWSQLCHLGTLKFALPAEDFEALRHKIRTKGLGFGAHAWAIENATSEERLRDYLFRRGCSTLQATKTAYHPHVDARYGEWDTDPLITALEDAGVADEGHSKIFRR